MQDSAQDDSREARLTRIPTRDVTVATAAGLRNSTPWPNKILFPSKSRQFSRDRRPAGRFATRGTHVALL